MTPFAPAPIRDARWAIAVIGCACALGAAAQSAAVDSDAPPPVPGMVLSDVEMLPAEDRESHGAVVVDGDQVRAQKAQQANTKPVVPSRVGRDASNLVERTRSWNDPLDADAQDQAPSGEASGAGPADPPGLGQEQR